MLNRICFRGFEPTSELKCRVEKCLSDLMQYAPLDSTWITLVERDGESYVARMDVYSKEGPFLVDARDSNPEPAIAQLGVQMRAHLEGWQRRRAKGRRTVAGRAVQPFPAA